jgi:hypothetical protein
VSPEGDDETPEDHLSDEDDGEGEDSIEEPDDKDKEDDELQDDDEVIEEESQPTEDEIAVQTKDYPVETVIEYKVKGKPREVAIRSKGELSPTTIKELTKKYELADGIQAKLSEERKGWEAKEQDYLSQVNSAKTELKERVRLLEREKMLDSVIEPAFNALRNDELVLRALVESKDPRIQQALAKEGWRGLPQGYNRTVYAQTVENQQNSMELEMHAINNAITPVYEGFIKEKGLDKKGMNDFIQFARDQGISFEVMTNEEGHFDKPENYAMFVERNLKAAYGLAVEAGRVPAKKVRAEKQGRKALSDDNTDSKLKQREIERMKNKNRRVATATGSGSSTGGGRQIVPLREGESVVEALVRDDDIKKEWAKIN